MSIETMKKLGELLARHAEEMKNRPHPVVNFAKITKAQSSASYTYEDAHRDQAWLDRARHLARRQLNANANSCCTTYGAGYACRCARPVPRDQLDVAHDGKTLRELLEDDEINRRDESEHRYRFTPAQRAAISAHWSAQLRAKLEASRKDAAAAAVSVYVEQEAE